MKKAAVFLTIFVFAFGLSNGHGQVCLSDSLRLSEIRFNPLPGDPQFVEIINIGEHPVGLPGVTVAAGDRNYTIPLTVTEMMQPEQIVLILFDGADPSTDDVLFSNNGRVVLHGPAGEFLGNPVGHCGLYRTAGVRSPQLLLDFVAWGGEPGDHAKDAVRKPINPWPGVQFFIHTNPDEPIFGPSTPAKTSLNPGETLIWTNEGVWVIGDLARVTPGERDPGGLRFPAPTLPLDGEGFIANPDRFAWESIPDLAEYELRVASDETFSSIEATFRGAESQTILETPLGPGQYWWQVRSFDKDDNPSDWSPARTFEIRSPPTPPELPVINGDAFSEPDSLSPQALIGPDVIGIIYDRNSYLPLSGVTVSAGGVSDTSNLLGFFSLNGLANGPHQLTATLANYITETTTVTVGLLTTSVAVGMASQTGSVPVVAMGARKETTMLVITPTPGNNFLPVTRFGAMPWDSPLPRATHTGNDLEANWCWAVSARILNRFFGGSQSNDEIAWRVKGDLINQPANFGEVETALRYALGVEMDRFDIHNSKPSSTTVVNYINAGRPLYFAFGWPGGGVGHIVTVAAYRHVDNRMQIQCVNDDNNGNSTWIFYDTLNNRTFWRFYVPKTGIAAPAAHPDLGSGAAPAPDSDGDGVNDFDEKVRFPAYYIAQGAGGTLNYLSEDTDGDGISDKNEIASWVFRTPRIFPDVDGDGLFPELDEDTDGGGIKDGDEDLNKNGIVDPGETDPYDRTDDRVLDLAFVIDTTGSMGPYINQVKANAIAIVNRVEEDFKNFRIAVVEYRDHPPEDTRPYLARRAFSQDKNAIIAAINALTPGGGGDIPESLNYALINTANAVNLLDGDGVGWRGQAGDTIRRAIIYMTDAPAHNPEPTTGLTIAMAAAVLNSGGIRGASGSIGLLSFGEGDGFLPAEDPFIPPSGPERSGPITVYPVVVTSNARARQDAEEFAGATGGIALFTVASGVTDAILAALEDITLAPNAILVVSDEEGNPDVRDATMVVADLSRSVDPAGCGIVLYEWDWNGDGIFDETTVIPVMTRPYPSGFRGSIRARVTTFSGETAVTSFSLGLTEEPAMTVTVDAAPVLNRQTGVYEQFVTVTNESGTTVDAFRITISGLAGGITVYNATGTDGSGNSLIQINQPLAPGASLGFRIEYYSDDRVTVPNPDLTVEPTAFAPPPVVEGERRNVRRTVMLDDGSFLIEFDTVSGREYVIEYTSDFNNWKQATPSITAFGSRLQWIDSGPSKTDSLPGSEAQRFYRVVELP